MSDQSTAQGFVEPGFERVQIEFERNFAERGELGAAFCVYHRGRKVVDLWGGHVDVARTKPWREDSMTTVFSTTKGVAALVLAVAHSRGWFEWDAPVADYWPEFAQNGKAAVTVRQLLAHQAGLAAVDEPLDAEILGDLDRLAPLLAKQAPNWEPGTHHGYHAISIGWFQNELLRRVDPEHRSIGQFLREEIAPKLGLELYIGLPESVDVARLAPMVMPGLRASLRHRGRPYTIPGRMVARMLWPWSLTGRAFGNPRTSGGATAMQSLPWRSIEMPSANGISDARSLARFYSAFAMGGDELGIRPETLAGLMADPVAPSGGWYDLVLLNDSIGFSLGFTKSIHGYGFASSPGAFGTPGAGGSFAFADPDARVAMGYVMNRMGSYLLDDPREKNLRDATYRALARFGPGE